MTKPFPYEYYPLDKFSHFITFNRIDIIKHIALKLVVENSISQMDLDNDWPSFVYVATSELHEPSYKIGKTVTGQTRLSQLRYTYMDGYKPIVPYKILCYNDPSILEKVLHKIFLIGGGQGREWFTLYEWDLAWLQSIQSVNTSTLNSLIHTPDKFIIEKAIVIWMIGKYNFDIGNKMTLNHTGTGIHYARYSKL